MHTLRILPLICAIAASIAGERLAWWEGEAADTAIPAASWMAPANAQERANLSAGAWLATDKAKAGATARWQMEAPGGGPLELWVRRFGDHGRLRWRFDDQPWAEEPADRDKGEGMPLDIRGSRYLAAGWLRLGRVDLPAGRHDFAIELLRDGMCAIDCFALLEPGRRPNGAQRPGTPSAAAPGWFTWTPPWPEGGASPVDLRRLNPRVAGEGGWLRSEGERFVDGAGRPVRFWGVSAGVEPGAMPAEALAAWAGRLARRGVNLVRIHAAPYYERTPGPLTRRVQAMVAACKAEGISVALNWYCLATCHLPADWDGADGLKGGDVPHSLHLFHPPVQEAYRAWARTLLTTPGPDGAPPLGRDPAVAFLELVDEDNFLFWTFKPAGMPEPVRAGLERRFAAWAAQRHGSLDAALAAWGPGKEPAGGDRPAEGRLALYAAMHLGGADWMRAQRNEARAGDQLRFLIETQRAWYEDTRRWLREEVGYGGPVLGTNWHTIDERVAGPAELHANSCLDLTARNTYFSGEHRRQKFNPWMVGDGVRDRSLLREPEQAIAMHIQAEGRPHVITEGGFTRPNRFRTEEQLAMAALASMQGIDGLCPFVVEGHWCGHLNYTWPISTPATLGQYPAAALLYRRSDVREGPVVLRDAIPLAAVFAFRGGLTSTKLGDDFHAQSGGDQQRTAAAPGIDPLAFWTGRVVRAIAEDPGATAMLPALPGCIDRAAKRVRSATGEMDLDWGLGLLVVDTPRAQGVTGFLAAAGPRRTAAADFALGNEYGAAILISLDDLPIAQSRSLLLQVMSEERSAGWGEEDAQVAFSDKAPPVAARRITSIGGAPIEVRELTGTVSLRRPDAATLRVTALDADLRPLRPMGTAERIVLAPTVLHYHIAAP